MECQECQQRPATLHFKQVINGNKKETHVCGVCAKEKGYMMDQEEGYSLHNLLTGLFNFDSIQIGNHNEAAFKTKKDLQCKECKLTFSEFQRTGKFGCAQCYEAFSSRLDPIFRRVHSGNIKHHGKIPKRIGGDLHTKKKLETYKSQLEDLIKNEAFEEAAMIRDKIKELKSKESDIKEGEDE